ncbi:glycosyltransferase family 2 protein [Sabulicella glaciei]|uniref:Glycosyltransferase n=1 Tax=Sabulicella glaciei TaxID=2984948 RepID=A0ABT3NZC3_9PROT|nr:glycosyltransferase [Roseococcus sp. MDT2-1-1]MCW8087513.1 glycosyltransferase [Roseococcus sp. MDT2-1-1]
MSDHKPAGAPADQEIRDLRARIQALQDELLLAEHRALHARAQAERYKRVAKEANREKEEAVRKIEGAYRVAREARHAAEAVLNSTLWRTMTPILATAKAVKSMRGRPAAPSASGFASPPGAYSEAAANAANEPLPQDRGPALDPEFFVRWISHSDALTDWDRGAIKEDVSRFSRRPVISVVMPVYNTPEAGLRRAVAAVRAQLYENWELCIADDASTAEHIRPFLEASAAQDSRIRWIARPTNGNICAATNSALSLAGGDYVVFLDHDDILSERALYEIAAAVNDAPDLEILYSDEDRIEENGDRRHTPYFKPGWDPDLLLGQNFVCHLAAYRRTLVEAVGGLRVGFEGSQDHDLILRASRLVEPHQIRHVPGLLYHWRTQSGSFSSEQLDRCIQAARVAVRDHLASRPDADGAQVVPHPNVPEFHRVVWPLPAEAPRVTTIIATRDRAELLRSATAGLLHRTNYANLEVVIVDNGSEQPEALTLLEELRQDPRVRVLQEPGPFNYSKLNNVGAAAASGEVLLLLNNDILVIEPDWLREMVSHAIRPGIGTVGAKLLFPDRTIQHAGVVLGIGDFADGPGVAGHFGLGDEQSDRGYFSHNFLTRTVSANTAACLTVRSEVFRHVGGFNEVDLAISFNDVDFCLRIQDLGLRHIWTPFAQLYHLESASRGRDDMTSESKVRAEREGRYMRERWGAVLDSDPYYNPHFSRWNHWYELEIPDRMPKRWKRDNRAT